jgi:protoheme IX farnesyltransferase
MTVYTVLLTACTLVLGPVGDLGVIYMVSAAILGAGFLASVVMLGRQPSPGRSMRVFAFSITYVTVLFVAMAVDVLVGSRS